jgi:hypothetical protein
MMGGAMAVVMLVMMGGMLVGFAWSFIRRRRGKHDGQ